MSRSGVGRRAGSVPGSRLTVFGDASNFQPRLLVTADILPFNAIPNHFSAFRSAIDFFIVAILVSIDILSNIPAFSSGVILLIMFILS